MKYFDKAFICLICVSFGLLFSSCKKDYICPAYQSYYLLDSAKRQQHFSLFAEDSLPREIIEVKKNKFGIMEKMSYRRKSTSLNTLPMTMIYPEVSDSSLLKIDSLQIMVGDTITYLN
ncbi:MAG TPA: hypothetical protein VD908_04315 [Cytophagales bacterium]|nr:hypothetical protein [Cytophagales bacterium]